MSICDFPGCEGDLDAYLSFKCNYCGGSFCSNHRLPSMHSCPNMDTLKSRPIPTKAMWGYSEGGLTEPPIIQTPERDYGKRGCWIKKAVVILLFFGLIGGSFYLGYRYGEEGFSSTQIPTSMTPTPTPTPTPATTPEATPTPTPVPVYVPPTPTPTPEPVDFVVYVDSSEIETCGLTCRKIPATLKNTGWKDAHNVTVKLEVFCKVDRVDINGQDYITEYIGNLPAGQTVTMIKEINVDFFDGIRIQNNGARIVLTITSIEKDKTLEQWYNL